jgi:cysteine desulfurase
MSRIYLDSNAASVPLKEVINKINESLSLCGNPSSFHEQGRLVRSALDEARAHIALALNAHAKEIIFCSGASEANRLFVDALLLYAKQNTQLLHVLISPFEHPSLLKPILYAHEQGLIALNFLELDNNHKIIINKNLLNSCDLLICTEAHNETGIIPPLDDLLSAVSPKTIVMSDAAQSFARIKAPSSRIDALTFSAQKIGSFAGAGGLLLRNNAKALKAPWLGGSQEAGFRPGTEASLLIIAMGEAARYIERERKAHRQLASLRDYLEEEVAQENKAHIIGNKNNRLPNTSAISFFAHNNPDSLRIACDLSSLSVGFGSACSGLAPLQSFALTRMGLNMHEQKTCIRFSLSPQTTLDEIDEAIKRMRHILKS